MRQIIPIAAESTDYAADDPKAPAIFARAAKALPADRFIARISAGKEAEVRAWMLPAALLDVVSKLVLP